MTLDLIFSSSENGRLDIRYKIDEEGETEIREGLFIDGETLRLNGLEVFYEERYEEFFTVLGGKNVAVCPNIKARILSDDFERLDSGHDLSEKHEPGTLMTFKTQKKLPVYKCKGDGRHRIAMNCSNPSAYHSAVAAGIREAMKFAGDVILVDPKANPSAPITTVFRCGGDGLLRKLEIQGDVMPFGLQPTSVAVAPLGSTRYDSFSGKMSQGDFHQLGTSDISVVVNID